MSKGDQSGLTKSHDRLPKKGLTEAPSNVPNACESNSLQSQFATDREILAQYVEFQNKNYDDNPVAKDTTRARPKSE